MIAALRPVKKIMWPSEKKGAQLPIPEVINRQTDTDDMRCWTYSFFLISVSTYKLIGFQNNFFWTTGQTTYWKPANQRNK